MFISSTSIAGRVLITRHGQCENYAFITKHNRVDLADFIAITGSDESRTFDQVIFTAASGHNGRPIEHGILVSGHFDHDRIFRNPSGNEAIIQYRGIAILDVSPLERERSFFKHRRWLAVLGSSTAIFGTIASVEVEIDRDLDGSPPDEAILQRLARLQPDDEEWSLLPAIGHGTTVFHQLRLLDPSLADLVETAVLWPSGYAMVVELSLNLQSILIPNPALHPCLNRYRSCPLLSSSMSPCCCVVLALLKWSISSCIAF